MKAICSGAVARLGSLCLCFLVSFVSADAGSATWNVTPTTGNWNTSANWSPATVPNGPDDVATFANSSKTAIALSAMTEIDSIVFSPGASAFTIQAASSFLPLNVTGAGVINNSGTIQNFVVGNTAYLNFYGTATAGNGIIYTANGGVGSSVIYFSDSSSAADSTFLVEGGYMVFDTAATAADAAFVIEGATPAHGGGGLIEFNNTSTAGNATFTVNGATIASPQGGAISLIGAKAGNSTIIVNGGTTADATGGVVEFLNVSDAENSTLIANGGTNGGLPGIFHFSGNSRGGKARVEVFDTGEFDMSYRRPGLELAVGSIEGTGIIFLGGNQLSVGGNALNTVFYGTLQDGGFQGGQHGSLAKTGSGRLTLAGANTYTGGTTVAGGSLYVRNVTGSGTGSGPVQVNRGTLGGTGIIAGAVTLGSATASPTSLTPGNSKTLGTLTIQKTLTFNSGATYDFALNSSRSAADQVIASGVTIANGAILSAADNGNMVLSPGTVFTCIRNTSASAIGGTFSNLPDGGTITFGSNTYQANYEGGDGNDLTLTVVP
jgi:autotransporter-associated beta strand protein